VPAGFGRSAQAIGRIGHRNTNSVINPLNCSRDIAISGLHSSPQSDFVAILP
jgi:hypothetical protein